MVVSRIELDEVRHYVDMRREFVADNVSATRDLKGLSSKGLGAAWKSLWKAQRRRMVYVVCSDGLPIAWVLKDGTTVVVDQELSELQASRRTLVTAGL